MTPAPESPVGNSRPSTTNPSQMVTVNIAEAGQENPGHFHVEVSECVETKTITTTTRLTRKFPHVFESNPTSLEELDTKEFPLALKPTPPELLNFTYNMGASDPAEGCTQSSDVVSCHLSR